MRNLGNIKIITGAELAVVLADDTQLTIDSEHISMNGIVLDDSTSVDGQFTIGAAVTGQLTITILNEDELYSPYNFRDATCQLTLLGVEEIPDDEEEMEEDSIIIGQYNIVDYTYDGSDITLTAYDNLSKFDFPCTETKGETVTFPMTLTALVQTAARICGVTLVSQLSPIPNGSYSVAQQPEGWDTMTWHDVIAYCAQLGGVYAKVDKYGRVFFDWYNINAIPEGYDGGTFDTQDTPYSDGDELDGGDFTYTTADSADGGTFTYPADMHFIDSPYSLTIDTDDVAITGLKVVLATADNINADENTQDYTTALYGTDGYVVTISGNPFIQTTAQADAIKDFLGAVVTGLWFRPLNATIDDDLSIEAGDQAYITGVDGNTYQCFISHVTYTTYAATTIACDAEPNKSSEKTRFTASDKLAVHVANIKKRVESVSKIAGNTNQYFWHTETGTDTGAHITEVPQEEWDDPNSQNYHSGGNLLARGNGLAMRVGLQEMSRVTQDGFEVLTPGGFVIGHIGYGTVTMSDGGTDNGPYYTFGLRNSNSAIGYMSTVIGTGEATAFKAIALNAGKAHGEKSLACGTYSVADSDDQVVIGRFCDPDANDQYAFIIGIGTGVSDLKNGVTVDWDGNIVSNAAPTSGSLTSPITTGSVYRNVCTRKGDMVNVAYHRANFTARNPSSVIATLPAGFRPKVAQYIQGIVYTTEWVPTTMVVSTNGEISAAYAPATTCTHAQIVGTFFI